MTVATINDARSAAVPSALHSAAQAWLARHPTLPLPGDGQTLARWRVLADIAAEDVCLAKLLEAHYDAQAILAELGARPAGSDELWGVWAAEPPADTVQFETRDGGVLDGTKSWCSGAGSLSHALVTARQGEARVLVAVTLDESAQADASGWQAVGMQRIQTAQVRFDNTPARLIGGAGQYVERSGFWHGGAGIAACWYGATRAIAERLRRDRRIAADAHAAAHLGAIDMHLSALVALLRQTAARIDARPALAHQREVMQLRAAAEATAREVIDRCARALGPGPLCTEGTHAQRCADLQVFIRQHHAERDLQALGELAAEDASSWTL